MKRNKRVSNLNKGRKKLRSHWKPGDPRENLTSTKSEQVDFISAEYQKQ